MGKGRRGGKGAISDKKNGKGEEGGGRVQFFFFTEMIRAVENSEFFSISRFMMEIRTPVEE